MRIARHAVFAGLLVAVAACGDTNKETFNPLSPDPTKALVRMFNATNVAVNFAAGGEPATTLNSNLGYGGSRCFQVDPANPALVIETSEVTSGTPPVTTPAAPIAFTTTPALTAGESYMVVLYNPTTATTPTFSTAIWDVNEPSAFTPHADSSGLRAFNAAPTAGALDLYVNAPAVAPATEPALAAELRKETNLPVGTLGSFFNVAGGATYQYRATRTGVTSTTLVNATNTVQKGEKATVILGRPASGTTTVRGTTTQGC
jgi:hypothetical protein